MKYFIAIMLIFLGIGVIAYPYLSEMHQDNQGQKLLADYENQLEKGTTDINIKFFDIENETVDKDSIFGNTEKIKSSEIGKIIGIISIPKIDLKLAIVEGTSNTVLNHNVVGHMIGTTYPGEEGNCALASQRSVKKGRKFNRLNEVNVNDKIIIKTETGEYTYNVLKKYVINKNDTSPLNYNAGERLITLITCDPLGVKNSPDRLIVKCELEI